MSKTEETLTKFRNWMKEKNISQEIDNNILLRFLYIYNGDLEQAKDLLIINLKLRQQHKNIFTNRNFHSYEIQNVLKVTQCFSLPRNTLNNYRITIFKLAEFDPDKYVFDDVAKLIFMAFDARFSMPEYDTDGEIAIIDVSGFTLRHLMKVKVSTAKLYLKYVQEAAPLRIVQNHFINCSSIVDKIMLLAKPFIKKELYDVIHFHTPKSDTLFNFISKDDLPKEYGGNLDSIEKLYDDWLVKIQRKSRFLLHDEIWNFDD